MTPITWTNDTRRLQDLVPWEHNPKRMTKKQADGLRLSIERFGFAVPFLVSPTGDIYDGHQRQALMGAIKQYGPNATVDVRVSSRPLTDDERRELVVRLKQNQAGWDFDMLPNLYENTELLEWGFEEHELGMAYGNTSTDREHQGVTSTWGQVNASDHVPVKIGDIETRLTGDVFIELRDTLDRVFTEQRKPVFETFEAIINHGIDALRDS
jgi:hypothetical protein